MPDTEVAPTAASVGDVDDLRRELDHARPCSTCGHADMYNFSTGDTNNPYLCDDHLALCNDCGEGVSRSHSYPMGWLRTDDGWVCPECSDAYGTCNECFHVSHTDQLELYNHIYYCTEHLPAWSDHEDPDNNDDVQMNDGINDHNGGRVIRDYHESRHILHKISSPWTRSHNRYIGVELEVEQIHGDRTMTARKILDSVHTHGTEITADKEHGRLLCAEQDGSLTHGFELVTAPLGLDDQRSLWTHILTSDKIKGLRSHNTTTCGLHVHISRNKLTQLQIAKVVAFVNSATNYAFIKRLARRYGTHYCIAKNIPLCNGAKNLSDDRYEMVNLCNTNTIEFRIFRGTLKLESLLACIEFANALVAYADCSSGAGMDITAARFRQFITQPGMKADTAFLRSYLASVVPPTDTE